MAELAKITKGGKLVSRRSWEKHIASLSAAADFKASKRQLKETLKEKISEAVEKRIPNKKFGIMFSGGVDSSTIALLAKQLKAKFICYSVGMENSKDVAEAKKAAKKLNFKLRCKTFTLPEAEKLIKKAVKITGEPNVVNAGVAAVEIAAIDLAGKDGINAFFGGLGSEEIFAGYRRHETADVNKECWRGLKQMWSRDLLRDSKVAAAAKAVFLVPFLDPELITAAMKIPGKYKINGNGKKIILREAAAELGLPKQFAYRKKIAAQYGSGFDRAIEKLAKANGYKYKKDYLASVL
ncbi:asparagine synthase C-terminal domain-containing protein [Candidatus Woesearchaeota archaeon]|nr:asparagine synthase C-terminal domain-containing protein [Candidatus Woesearchaeota archaeon]